MEYPKRPKEYPQIATAVSIMPRIEQDEAQTLYTALMTDTLIDEVDENEPVRES